MFRAGKSRYTTHPGSGATVDWSNPTTQGLRSLIVAGQPFGADIVRGEATTTLMSGWSAIQSAITEHGIVVDGAASANSCQYVSPPREFLVAPPGITMFATAQNDRSGSDPVAAAFLMCFGSSAANATLAGLGTGVTNARLGRFSFRDATNSTRADFSTTNEVWAAGDKGQKVIAASYAGPGTQLMCVNGAAQALTVTTQLSLAALAPTSFALGALFRSIPASSPRLKTGIGGVWDRALSARELEELTTNPWGLIAVPRGRSFVAVGYTSSGIAAVFDGSASATATAAAALATAIRMAGAASSQAATSAQITTSIRLVGDAVATATASAALSTGGAALAGAATAQSSASAGLATQITIAGVAASSASASAQLSTSPAGFAGAAVANASSTAQLTTAIRLAGAANSQASASAAMATASAISGAAMAQAIASASLSTQIVFSGSTSASAASAGALITGIRLSGAAMSSASSALYLGALLPELPPLSVPAVRAFIASARRPNLSSARRPNL